MIIRKEIGDSLTLKFAESVNARRLAGGDIISLGIGESDFEVPIYLREGLEQAVKIKKYGYLPSLGLMELRELISQNYILKGYNYKPNQIVITNGAKHALQLALTSILNPGDEIIYFSPYYVSYPAQIFLAEPQARPVEIKLNEKTFDLEIEKIKKKISGRTKAIIINQPHNPTGKVFKRKDIEELISLALKYNLQIISDEVYDSLIFANVNYTDLGTYSELKDLLYVVNSYSKSFAIAGWRIGYLMAPKHIIPILSKIIQHTQTNVSSVIQYAVRNIYYNEITHLDRYKETLKERADFLNDKIDIIFNLNSFKPEAGFLKFFSIKRTKMDSNTFCSELIEKKGVALTPGIAFGRNWDDHVRLSFAVSMDELIEGLNRINSFIV